jgi:D-tyrosyl-tRNA(Tyr) deacylase
LAGQSFFIHSDKTEQSMRAVIQRVKRASVRVEDKLISEIGGGLLVFLGLQEQDNNNDINWMADKIINLRIFEDNDGKMNLSLADTSREMLIVSQFTLYGDCRKGRRPGFSRAARPELSEPLYQQFIAEVRRRGVNAQTGIFQAEMAVELINDGPVTLLLDSEKKF